MPSFQYSALDSAGRSVNGSIEAPGRTDAIARLTQRSIYVTDIANSDAASDRQKDQQAKAEPQASPIRSPWSRRVSLRLRTAMLQQLATALSAGPELLPALRVVQQQAANDALRSLVADLADRVRSGESLSDAMAEHPRDFSRLETSMVRVGETAGVLDQVMGHLADFAERDLDVRERIRSAATYPVFVLALAAVSVVIIVTVVLPGVIGAIAEGITLPLPTRILLGISTAIRSFWWLLLIALALVIWAFRAWLAQWLPGKSFPRRLAELRIAPSKLGMFQALAGLPDPLSPDDSRFVYYDTAADRIVLLNLRDGSEQLLPIGVRAGCWLDSQRFAAADDQDLRLFSDPDEPPAPLMHGQWLPRHGSRDELILCTPGRHRGLFSLVRMRVLTGQ